MIDAVNPKVEERINLQSLMEGSGLEADLESSEPLTNNIGFSSDESDDQDSNGNLVLILTTQL